MAEVCYGRGQNEDKQQQWMKTSVAHAFGKKINGTFLTVILKNGPYCIKYLAEEENRNFANI